GSALEPSARAGRPAMKRLHPLFPDTRSTKGCSFSSMHSPIVSSSVSTPGSICHHLQSRHNPHSALEGVMVMAPLKESLLVPFHNDATHGDAKPMPGFAVWGARPPGM